jgi:large subunit ribosomal protein L21e
MVNSKGQRNRTRDMFSRPFRQHGLPAPASYLQNFHLGDYVDVVANGAIHKGMPHKYYHGRTGRVWNVTPRAIGVEINKRVGGRVMKKRLHVRVEHVKKSKCREGFLQRVKDNEVARREIKAGTRKAQDLKRIPKPAKAGAIVKVSKSIAETLHVLPYELLC